LGVVARLVGGFGGCRWGTTRDADIAAEQRVYTRACPHWCMRACTQELVIAHVGDCRAVLASKDGTVNVLTKDHTFFNHEVLS
jgi:serine/threonine protein phosphatase PrpC